MSLNAFDEGRLLNNYPWWIKETTNFAMVHLRRYGAIYGIMLWWTKVRVRSLINVKASRGGFVILIYEVRFWGTLKIIKKISGILNQSSRIYVYLCRYSAP